MARIIICGYMIRHPVVGNLLAFFHYLLGFSKMGHQVIYLEESGWSQSCYDPSSRNYSDDPEPGIRVVKNLFSRFGINAELGFINRETGRIYGLVWDDIKEALKTADLLLNIGGVCWLPDFKLCQRRALIDIDPFFTQIGKFAIGGLEDYQTLFSYGTNIGEFGCSIPTYGRDWLPTVPPVVPEIWTDESPTNSAYLKSNTDIPFTTVANWTAYGSITYEGKTYGQKREEFLRLLDLPKRSPFPLELALGGIDPKERKQFEVAGWQIRDSQFSENFEEYQAYITQSKGEFSVAKQAYVITRSGWFSDRSVCYLAAGCPTVLQDTGFRDEFSSGNGLLMFSTLDEAVDSLNSVKDDYLHHSKAARKIAERVFSYRIVLPRLLNLALHAKSGHQTTHFLGD
ncbi:MAG: glycosyltransferase family 1 protein [Moorea sp. SIO4G2]|nr:glycosyltransferase family 1 protein [Moorena sp. SIO4G2]